MSLYLRHGEYYYDFWFRGARFHGATGTASKRDAKRIEDTARETARQTLRRRAAQHAAGMTVDVAFGRFWVEKGSTYSGNWGKTVFAALAWMREEFGPGTLLRDLGPSRISAAIAKRRGQGVSNTTANHTLTELLRTVLKRARRLWEQSDLPDIDWPALKLPEPPIRVRELRDGEEEKLKGAIPSDYMPVLQFALASGMRKKELIDMRWHHIDWRAETIAITGKGEKSATIPLTARMKAILSTEHGHHPEHIWTYVARRSRDGRRHGERQPMTYSGLNTVWRRYGPKGHAAIDDYRFHDNRHTLATRLLRTSGNLVLVQKQLRHSDISATVRYAHADDADLRQALKAMETSEQMPSLTPAATSTIGKKVTK